MRAVTTFALLSSLALGGCFEYSDGARQGVITKFSKRGFFCKTWEAEMVLGGTRNKSTVHSDGTTTSSLVANVWAFTVEDPRLLQKVEDAFKRGDVVTVSYREELVSFCRSDSSNYFATGISALGQ